MILAPLARNAEEPIGSMGNDIALAVLSDRAPLLYSLLQAAVRAGHEPADRLDPRGDRDERRHERRLRAQPARRDARARAPARDRPADPARRRARAAAPGRLAILQGAHARHRPGRSPTAPTGCDARARRASAREADEALDDGVNILILSDRAVGAERAPIPALLAVVGRAPPPRARRARACRPGSSSSRASRARCTTSRR